MLAAAVLSAPAFAAAPSRPNIVFILADDLGYGELGSYGQKQIATPSLDRMAAEGMRFTQFYAGNTVCAPSRSVLMTGLNMGHTRVRGNAGPNDKSSQTLQAQDVTVARILQQSGYATGLIGKWGLGEIGTTGEPSKQGFDYHFGYINQSHAHNHFPSFLIRNGEKVALANDLVKMGEVDGVGYSTKRVAYADDLFAQESLDFITLNKDRPFFLFFSMVTPHANNERSKALGDGNEVPDQGIYADKPWTESARNHAAMVSRLDRDVGRVLAHLKALGLDEKTMVVFSSDNGPHQEGGPNYDPKFFSASGPLRGIKRSMTDGGLRVPFIVRWPGKIKPGVVSGQVGYFGDLMATWSELAGGKLPAKTDSLSLLPTLLSQGAQAQHDYLYWEFYEQGTSQAALLDGHWKVIRLKTVSAPIEVYDLSSDLAEKPDVAAQHPEIVARAIEVFETAHVDNEYWKIPAKAGASAAEKN